MGKFEKKKTRKKKKAWKGFVIAFVLVMFLAVLGLFVMPQVLYRLNSDPEPETLVQNTETTAAVSDEQPAADASQPSDSGVTFPCVLEDGKLEVESLFQFDGINPDAGNQEATDVAAIVVRNLSGTYLQTATVTAALDDGAVRTFAVQDLPAGKSAMVFSTDNALLSESHKCADLSVESVFEDPLSNDSVKVSVDGMTVTLENISGETLSGIDVYCRDVFGDQYFGGVAYQYTIETLSAGETTTVTVLDSLMGITEVVRVAVNDQN